MTRKQQLSAIAHGAAPANADELREVAKWAQGRIEALEWELLRLIPSAKEEDIATIQVVLHESKNHEC